MKKLLSCIIGIGLTVPLAFAATISPPAAPSVSAGGNSFNPVFSADGQKLVFVSHANNLVTNDNLGLWLDVFVRDLVTSNTVLVSVSTNGTGGANWDANYPSVSSNGQFIAFVSSASNLVPGATNDLFANIFVRDVNAGLTRLVSVDTNGSPASLESANPHISADGRYVLFESRANNLTADSEGGNKVHLYRRDLWSNVTVRASEFVSSVPLIRHELGGTTPDGQFTAYIRRTNSIIPSTDAFVHQVGASTTWVSVNVAGLLPGGYQCSAPVISDDGRYAAFYATPSAGGNTLALHHDTLTGTTLVISSLATNLNHGLQISANGQRVLFEFMDGIYARPAIWETTGGGITTPIVCNGLDLRGNPAMTPTASAVAYIGCSNVYFAAPTNLLVSASTNGSASNGDYQFVTPAISPDGARVAFAVTANDLVTGDLNGQSDIFLRDVTTGVTELITQAAPSKPATTAFAHSFLGPNSISADGRFIVSTRYDDPSAHRDTNGLMDVFATDALNGTSRALSINTNLYYLNTDGEAAASAGMFIANTNIFRNPVISADGSTVMAVWLSGGYYTKIFGTTLTNGLLNSESMSLVTRSVNGFGVPANVDSPSLSADGRRLAFRSDDVQNAFISFLPDSDGYSDIWLRYTRPREYPPFTLLTNYAKVSGYASAGGPSVAPVMSADGGTVLFATRGGYLLTESAGGVAGQYANYQVLAAWIGTNYSATNELGGFRQRLCTYTISFQPYEWFDAADTNIHRTNLNAVLTPVAVDITNAVFSANNRFVVYAHADGSAIWRHDLLATQTNYTFVSQAPPPNQLGSVVATNLVPGAANTLVCLSCRTPSVSADGRVVAYERVRAGTSIVDVFATDLTSGVETRVSANLAAAAANGSSTSPLVSGDGRYVVFQSKAGDLVAGDANGQTDIFVRDRLLGVTLLVNAPGNGPSTKPVLAANGRTVVFQSFASDLVAGDFNDKRDLFVLTLGSVDSEPDGMDDDWEMAYFETLSRDGSLDWDNDGATDLAEFLAGTDPKNDGSVFRVLTVAPAGGGATTLFWSGNPTRSYRAEFKDDITAPAWTALTGPISWNGTTASISDLTAGSATNRFYRVLRLP